MARKLTDEQMCKAEQQVMKYLTVNPAITNREMRALSRLSYDQCIDFFNRMVQSKRLARIGKASGTHYMLFGASESER